jgi:hypothetical protein
VAGRQNRSHRLHRRIKVELNKEYAAGDERQNPQYDHADKSLLLVRIGINVSTHAILRSSQLFEPLISWARKEKNDG